MPTVSRLAIAVLGLALGLPFWRWPRAVAAFLTLPGDHALPRIQDGRAVIPAQLRTLVASRKRMGRIRPPLYRPRPGRAYAGRDGRSRPCHAGRAITSCVPASRRPPARPHAWTRLAYAELLAMDRPKRPPPPSRWRAPLRPRAWPTVPRPELCLFSFAVPLGVQQGCGARPAPPAWRRDPKHLVALPRTTGRANLVESTLTANLEPPVKRRYAQPADD